MHSQLYSINESDTLAWLQEPGSLAALQTDEEIDSNDTKSSGFDGSGDSGCDSGCDSSGTESAQCSSGGGDMPASGADAGERMPEWSDDVALALARAAGPTLREPVLNELYVEWADPFCGVMGL